MKHVFKIAASALALAGACTAFPAASFADVKPKVLVPPHGTGPVISGAYRADGLLYDRFKLAVRLDPYGGGTYTAKVSWWESCSGGLSWHRGYGNKIHVRMTASRCNGPSGTWSADRMVCEAHGGYQPAKYEPKVLVPPPQHFTSLSCNYLPGSAYYSPTWISMRRS